MKTKYNPAFLFRGLIIVIICLFAEWLSATHIVGGSMYYQHVADNTYRIVLELRRDCAPGTAPFDDVAAFGVYYSNGQKVNVFPGIINGQILIPLSDSEFLNDTIESNCNVLGTQVCVHRTTYATELELPLPANGLGYIFTYQRCCRNGSLLNVQDPLNTGATYMVQITPEALQLKNSSPKFNEWPNIYTCLFSELDIDHSATGQEGDQLVYDLFTPYSGATMQNPRPQPGPPPPYDKIFWNSPYSIQDLLGGTEPLVIYENTGRITATTPGGGQFLIGVRVRQYRNGVLLSTVIRDFQINMRECVPPPVAKIDSITNNCGSLTLDFSRADRPDTSGLYDEYSWNFNDPVRFFVKTNDKTVTHTFSKEGTYKVWLKARRGLDGCTDSTMAEVKVLKNNLKPAFSHLLFGCKEGVDTLTIQFKDSSAITGTLDSILSREWTVIQNKDTLYRGDMPAFDLKFLKYDSVLVVLKVISAAGCDTTISEKLFLRDFVPDANFRYELAACDNDSLSVRLINTSRPVYPNGETVESDWNINGNSFMGDTLVLKFPVQPDTVQVSLKTSFSDLCEADITKNIVLSEIVSFPDFEFELVECATDSIVAVRFINKTKTLSGQDSLKDIQWDANGQVYHGDSIIINFPNVPDVFAVMLTAAYEINCKREITKNLIPGNLVPRADFSYRSLLCPDRDSVTIELSFVDSLSMGVSVDSITWNLALDNDKITLVGDSVAYNIHKESSLLVTLTACFSNGCSDIITKVVTPGPFADIHFSGIPLVLCPGDTATLFTGGNPAWTYTWNPTVGLDLTDPSAPVVIAGDSNVTYNVTVSDGICEVADSVRVIILEGGVDLTVSGDTISCDGSVRLIATGGIGAGFYEWSTDSTFTNIIATGDTLQTSFSGDSATYFVHFTNERCSTFPANFTVRRAAPADFVFNLVECTTDSTVSIRFINTTQPLFPQDSILFVEWTAGGDIYQGDSIVINFPNSLDTFSVTLYATYSANCTRKVTKRFVPGNLLPLADFLTRPVDCPDQDSVTIQLLFVDTLAMGVTVDSVIWNLLSENVMTTLTGDSVVYTMHKDRSLLVTFTAYFSNGCSDVITRVVKPGPFPDVTFTASDILLCPGDTAILFNNGNPAWTYTWNPQAGLNLSNPAAPYVIAGASNVTYYVTVSDGICEVTDSVRITILEGGVDLIISGDTISCDGTVKLSVSGGVGSGVYEWATDMNFNNIIGTGDSLNTTFTGLITTYYVRFKGEKCATIPVSITIRNARPQVDDSSPYTLCAGDMSEIVVINRVPGDILQYNWLSDPHVVSGGNTNRPKISIGQNESGTVILYYTVTNQYNCELKDSVLIKIAENGSITVKDSLTGCGELKVCFSVSGTYTGFISWDFGDPNTSADIALGPDACYTYPAYGTYSVTVKNLTTICPFKTEFREITLYPDIDISASEDKTICEGEMLTLNAGSNIPGTTFTWKDQNGNVVGSGQTFSVSPAGNTLFIVEGLDFRGCTDTDSIRVNVFAFNYQISVKDSICYEMTDNISLQISNPSDYTLQWSPTSQIISGSTGVNPVIKLKNDQEFTVIITHKETGCVDTGRVFVNVTKPFVFTVDAKTLCPGLDDTVNLQISNPGAYRYMWSPSDGIVSGANTTNPVVNFSQDKTLTVKVTEISSGCEQHLDVPIDVADPFEVELDSDPETEIYEGKSVKLFVEDPLSGISYYWNTGDSLVSEITVSPVEDSTYCVTGIDAFGCEMEDCIDVTVRKARCDETDIFIPNAFSPNGDGINDVFRVRSNFIDELLLIVYNRWGQEVFRTTDINGGWDGTFKGEELPSDAYAYYMRVICVNTLDYSKRGNVNLIR